MPLEPQCYVFFEDLTTHVQQCYLCENSKVAQQRMARLIVEYLPGNEWVSYQDLYRILQAIARHDLPLMVKLWAECFEGCDLRIITQPFNAHDTEASTSLYSEEFRLDLETKLNIATQAAKEEAALEPPEPTEDTDLPRNPFSAEDELG